MPTLELGVDARGVRQGLAEAERALDQTGKKAQQTEAAVKRMGTTAQASGNNLSAAFAATGGGLSVTRGLVSISDGFKSANVGMAAFAASQALLDVGRLAADMKAVSSATGATGGAFSKLGAIIKANPLLTIATVIAGAATAMGLFGKETKEAADEWDRIGKSIRSARLSEQVKSFLGISTTTARQKQVTGLEDLLESQFAQKGSRTLGQIASSSGFSIDQVRRAQLYTGGVTEMNPTRTVMGIGSDMSRLGRTSGVRRELLQLEDQVVSDEAAKNILGKLYADLSKSVLRQSELEKQGGSPNTSFSANPARSFYPGYDNAALQERRRLAQFRTEQRQGSAIVFGQGALGPNQFDVNFGGTSTAGDLIRQSPAEREQIDAAIRNRNIEESQRAMDELVQTGREFGATIGDAFFNVASGTQSARQALAALVADFARAASRQAFAGIFGAAASGFGATPKQKAADAPAPNNPGSNIQF